MANTIDPNNPKNKIPSQQTPVAAGGLSGGVNQPTVARQYSTPDGKPPQFVGRAARMDANQAKSEAANRGYTTAQLAEVAKKPIPGVDMTPNQANYEIARRAGAAMGLTNADGSSIYKDSPVTGQIRSPEEGRRINAGMDAENASARDLNAKNQSISAMRPDPTGGYGINSAKSGFEQSSNMGHTQMNPVMTPERIAIANSIQQQGGSLATGVKPVSQPAIQQFGGSFDRPHANRPLSAEAAQYQQDQVSQQKRFDQSPVATQAQKVGLDGRPLAPQPVNSTQAEAVRSAQSSTKGAMQAAMDKGKSFAGKAVNAGKGVAGSLKGGVPLALGVTAADLALTAAGDKEIDKMDQWATRFGVDAPTGDGSFGDIAKTAALSVGGFGTDLADTASMGMIGNLAYRDKTEGKDIWERLGDTAKTATGMGAGALAMHTVDKLSGGKAGMAKKLLAGAGAATLTDKAIDYYGGEGKWHAGNEEAQANNKQAPQEQAKTESSGESQNGEPQKGSNTFDPGYMKEGHTLKQGVFNENTVDVDKLNERASQNSMLAMPSGNSLSSGVSRQIMAPESPRKSGVVKVIKDSATEKRNAEVTAREAAGSMKNMSDRARAEIATEQQKNLDAQQIAAQRLGLEASQLGIEGQKAASLMQGNQMDAAVKGSALADATDARTLRKQLMTEQDPAKRKAIEDQLSYMSNGGSNRYSTIANMDGTTSVFDKRTGSIMPAESLAAM